MVFIDVLLLVLLWLYDKARVLKVRSAMDLCESTEENDFLCK